MQVFPAAVARCCVSSTLGAVFVDRA